MSTHPTIRSWSWSRLDTWETCAYRGKLQFVEHLPQPERKADHPAERGNAIHLEGETYVKEGGVVPASFRHFEPQMLKLRELYQQGIVSPEQDWHYDDAWQPTEDKYPWLRIKADLWVHGNEQSGVVIDHKSGKKFGNEIKHTQQTQLYAIGAFTRFEALEEVVTEIWYVDQNDVMAITYQRDQAMRLVPRWQARADRMMSDIVFRPRPGPGCKYCPYSPRGTGACPVGV